MKWKMLRIIFTQKAWSEYCYWQTQDKKTLKRINQLLKSICRLDNSIGKAEILKNELSGFSSRRIDNVNRLVYRIIDDCVEIIQCKGHYGN